MTVLLKYENVKWNLPFMTGKHIVFADNFIRKIHQAEDSYPVQYLHGSILCKWSGGDIIPTLNYNFEVPTSLKESFAKAVNVFSSYHITDEDLRDKDSNRILESYTEIKSEVEVSSDKLYDYIKSRFPYIITTASVVKSIYELEEGNEVEFYKRLLDKYDRVVLSPKYVKEKFMQDYDKFEDLSRFEIIVNDRCINNCPRIKDCIESVENDILFKNCPKNNMSLKDLYNSSLALNEEEMDNLVNIGINIFRLEGQDLASEDAKSVVTNYMLKRFGVATFFMYTVGGS